MKIYGVEAFVSSQEINLFHHHLFHGRKVGGKRHFLGDDLSEPMRLSINAYNLAGIIQPIISLVVSNRVAKMLTPYPGIGFLEVMFERVIDFPFSAGDFSYFSSPQFLRNPYANGPETLLQRSPESVEGRARITPYFELLVPRLSDVTNNFSGLVELPCHFSLCGLPLDCRWLVSEELFHSHPIVWSDVHIIRGDVFDIIGSFFDRHYFEIVELDL